jgi:hypothetical protein
MKNTGTASVRELLACQYVHSITYFNLNSYIIVRSTPLRLTHFSFDSFSSFICLHFNFYRFQHLKLECHPEESSIHRAAIISQYVNRGQTRSKRDLLDAVSNRQDKKFPVYRNGKHPDYLATGATG